MNWQGGSAVPFLFVAYAAVGEDGGVPSLSLPAMPHWEIRVTAPNYCEVTRRVRLEEGSRALRVGEVVLPRAYLRVTGRVVDRSGRPVVGALVSNHGDGRWALAVKTDARGRFSLWPLYAGPVAVTVKVKGQLVAGKLVQAGDTGVRITVGDTTVQRGQKPSAKQFAKLQRLVAEDMAEAAELLVRVHKQRHFPALELCDLAVVAPERTRKLFDTLSLPDSAGPEWYLASPLRPYPKWDSQAWNRTWNLVLAARHVFVGQPERARKLLDEAEKSARQIPQEGQRAGMLALVGQWVWLLDRHQGEALIREALASSDKCTAPRDFYELARGAALIDVKTAAGLARHGHPPAELPAQLAVRAAAAGEASLARSLKLVADHGSSEDALATAAILLAPRQPRTTLALAGRVQEPLLRARVVVAAGLGLALSDRKAAEQALEKAAAIVEEAAVSGDPNRWLHVLSEPAAVMGKVASAAQVLGTSRANEYVWRALALRAGGMKRDWPLTGSVLAEANAMAALGLASCAPAVARSLLKERVFPHFGPSPPLREAYAAAALADPDWAEQLLKLPDHFDDRDADALVARYRAVREALAVSPTTVLVVTEGRPRPYDWKTTALILYSARLWDAVAQQTARAR
ncbi:MAG: carboxypeptidase regulatory-like domain-containing protein [Armatimonadetes bacterium]|nr:carboxypeptidase regulatory-like domain-containing protein [Armatimonadota bacterium]